MSDQERRRHLEYHARTCDDPRGRRFAVCPFCRPLRREYIDLRIEEGSVRWFWFVSGDQELGGVGDGRGDVLERLLRRAGEADDDAVGIVLLDVADDQLWAQIRAGATTASAHAAADAFESVTAGAALSWIPDPDTAWLLRRYTE